MANKEIQIKILREAEKQFSSFGFWGASLSGIANKVGLTKQGVLHYYPSKEQLYDAVLVSAIETLLSGLAQYRQRYDNPQAVLKHLFTDMVDGQGRQLRIIILLFRELLDNREREANAKRWYLKPYLDELAKLTVQADIKGFNNPVDAFGLVDDLIGATQYLLISDTSLSEMFTAEQVSAFKDLQRQKISHLFDG